MPRCGADDALAVVRNLEGVRVEVTGPLLTPEPTGLRELTDVAPALQAARERTDVTGAVLVLWAEDGALYP